MYLKKINQTVNQDFDSDGNCIDRVDRARFEVKNNSNEAIGSAEITPSSVSLNLRLGGLGTVEQGETLLVSLLGEGAPGLVEAPMNDPE